MKTTTMRLDQITVDYNLQMRADGNSSETVLEYAENFDNLPPIKVYCDGDNNFLADGFHRFAAAQQLKKLRVSVEVEKGTKRDALLYALGANRAHGLRRSNADKRRAVETVLADEQWAKWSDRKVAEVAGVSHIFVASIRGQVETVSTSNSQNPVKTEETRIGKDGKEYPASKPKTPDIPAYDDSEYEDVEVEPKADKKKDKPEPTLKEQISSLRSVALQHYRAAMRAVDDLHRLKPDKKTVQIIAAANVTIQDAVERGFK